MTLLLLLACAPDELDLREPAPELEVPGLADVDLEALYVDALRRAIATDARVPWGAHLAALQDGEPACPNLFAGTPDLENMDVPEEDGWAWADHCTTAADRTFGGYAWWEDAVLTEGDAATAEGATTEGARTLVADGILADAEDAPLFAFDGEASDDLLRVDGEGYAHWAWSSVVTGAFEDATDAWRADLYLRATGGDAQTLELRGNLYLVRDRLAERFDSVAVDLEWAAPESLGEEDCALEPRGWIGVRDEDAYWYDLVFQPRHEDDPNEAPFEYGPCDGCGTLYVRGLEQKGIEVCPDLSFLWDGATLVPPAVSDLVLDERELLWGEP